MARPRPAGPGARRATEDQLEREASRLAGTPDLEGSQVAVNRAVRQPLSTLGRALHGGSAVDPPLRRDVEAATGADLSGVRVHRLEDRHPLPGRAFSVGSDILLPASATARTLRHELAHVVQSKGGGGDLSDASGKPVVRAEGGLTRQELEALQQWISAAEAERDGVREPWLTMSQPRLKAPATGPAPDPTLPLLDAAAVCPNCHQRPEEILAARRADEERRRRTREERERHGRWEASHAEEHANFLAGPKTTVAQDVEESRNQLAAQRTLLLAEAGRRSSLRRTSGHLARFPGAPATFGGPAPTGPEHRTPDFPESLGGLWTTAYQGTVVVRSLTAKDLFVPEAAALARQHFLDFYAAVIPVAEQGDRIDAETESRWRATADALRPAVNPCPSCHDTVPAQPRVLRAPPPSAPSLRASQDAVLRARTGQQWLAALSDFERATTVLDGLALRVVPSDTTVAQGFTEAQGLLSRQQDLARQDPGAVRIRAVFYPQDKWLQPSPPSGPKVEIAQGIPWYFYLTHTPTSREDGYPEGFRWTLRDITRPGRPEVSYAPNDVERYLRNGTLPVDRPPPALFEKLNDAHVFPVGMLYWRYPDGRQESIRTTEPWSLSDWLTAIGMGLTALGLLLASAGMATPALLTGLGIASAAFGVASTVADLQHRSELGILNDADVQRATFFIAVDIVSALTLGIGRAAALAGEASAAAGRTTRLFVQLRRAASVANVVDKSLGAMVVVTVGADYLQQYQAIMDAHLPDAERDAALHDLTISALFTGAVVLGPHVVAGTVKAMRGPRPTTPRGPEGHPPPGTDTELLARSTTKDVLPSAEAAQELAAADAVGRHQDLHGDGEYRRTIEIENHTWKEQRDGTGWCRFSTRKCYTAAQLRVGAGGTGERTTAATASEVAALRAELTKVPPTVRTDAARLDWADYVFYAERRLKAIESSLAAGKQAASPPRTFASFRLEHPLGSVVRNEIQGSRFESRTRAEIVAALGPARAELILSQHHISDVLNPTVAEGMLTRPDGLIPDAGGTWTAVSNKSRTSFAGKGAPAVEKQVVDDLLDALVKYTGEQHVRRTGQQIRVNRVFLLYDAAAVPPRHQPVIRRTVAAFGVEHTTSGITFEVGIF